MPRLCVRLLACALFGAVAVAVAVAADEKPAAKAGPPDWSKFVKVGDVAGEVTSADEETLSLKVTKTTVVMTGRRGRGRVRNEIEEYDLTYADAGTVKWKKGGAAADRTALKAGHLVDVILVRPKGVALAKLTDADLRVKSVVILGENPNAVAADKKMNKAK